MKRLVIRYSSAGRIFERVKSLRSLTTFSDMNMSQLAAKRNWLLFLTVLPKSPSSNAIQRASRRIIVDDSV